MFAELLILNAVSELQVPPSSIKMGNSWFRMYGKMSSGNNLNMIWVFLCVFSILISLRWVTFIIIYYLLLFFERGD